jgi:hypothetical protein
VGMDGASSADWARRTCHASGPSGRAAHLRVPVGAALEPPEAAPGATARGRRRRLPTCRTGGGGAVAVRGGFRRRRSAPARPRGARDRSSASRGGPARQLLAPALWPAESTRVKFVRPKANAPVPREPLDAGTWRLPRPRSRTRRGRARDSPRARSTWAGRGSGGRAEVLRASPSGSTAGSRRGGTGPALRRTVSVPRCRCWSSPRVRGRTGELRQAHQAGGAAVHLLLSASGRTNPAPGVGDGAELTHLAMPWILPTTWFSEGFVTYYQEVLRARAGPTLGGVLEGARGSLRPVGRLPRARWPRRAARAPNHAYHRVYWAARLALRFDLALRAATRAGGRSTTYAPDRRTGLHRAPRVARPDLWRRATGPRHAVLAGGARPLASSEFPRSTTSTRRSASRSKRHAALLRRPGQKALRGIHGRK